MRKCILLALTVCLTATAACSGTGKDTPAGKENSNGTKETNQNASNDTKKETEGSGTSAPQNNKEYLELFADTGFEQGFWLSAVKDSEGFNRRDKLDFGMEVGKPVWELAQWFTQYPLQGVQPVTKVDTVEYVNDGKRVAMKRAPGKSPVLTLEMFGGKEYSKGPRKDGEAWPHLLISQPIGEKPLVTELDQLVYSFNGTLDYCNNLMRGDFNKNLHSANVNTSIIIQNTNSQSPGYGDFYWYQMTFYDFREEFMPELLLVDGGKEGASGKVIYAPSGRELYTSKVEPGKLCEFSLDILPFIKRGVEKSKSKGGLKDTKLEDLRVTALVIGWEMFGTFDASFSVSDMSLKGYYKNKRTLAKNQPYESTFDNDQDWEKVQGDWACKDGMISNLDGKYWENRLALKDRTYSDFVMDFKMKYDDPNAGDQQWSGVTFRKANLVDTHEQSGLLLYIRGDGAMSVYRPGNPSVASAQIPDYKPNEFIQIRLSAVGDTYKVYARDMEKPIMEFQDNTSSEGYISLVTGMSKASFDDVKIQPQ